MVVLTKEQIIQKIMDSTSLSLDQVNTKIKQKLDQLSGLVSPDGAAHIVANELGVQVIPSTDQVLKINNLLEGLRNVELNVKVMKKFDKKDFQSARGPGKLASFIVADDSGRMRATFWNDKVDEFYDKFNENDTITIKNAYVRKNNYSGGLDLNLGDNCEIIVNPKGVEIDVQNYTPEQAQRKKISELQATDFNAEILATIVQVSDIRFWETCPKCNKKPRYEDEKYICKEHGEIPAKELGYSYVLNCYLDDGSASIRTVFWREQVQKLLEETHENILKFREEPDLFETYKSSLLGEMIKVSGRVNKNEAFDRIEFVANNIEKNPNPEQEIKNIKEDVSEENKIADNKETDNQTDIKENKKPETFKEVDKNKKQDAIPTLDDIEEVNIDDE